MNDATTLPVRLVVLLALLPPGAACRRAPEHTALDRVAAIHGAAGPFAVAGYRAGERALRELGLPPATFDIDVVHESPAQVQWSCIADGVQAATGASAGKLNLHLREVPRDQMRTVIRRKSTGQAVVFHYRPEFARRFLDRPRPDLPSAGGEVLALPDDEIFTVEKLPAR
jgi:formylmethanofuran dehydrogenase subunit E